MIASRRFTRLRSNLAPRGGTHASPVRTRAWALAVGLSVALSTAAAPTFWRVSTQAEFLRGEVDAVSVDADGHLSLGPVTDTFFDTSAPVLWSLATATDGALWVGSGNDGRVYRVDPSGRGAMVFDADEPDVYALAAAPDGGIFAATSPDGVIHRVTPDGVASTVIDLDETYVWALTTASDGALLAATGEPGRIYRIEPDTGESALLFESDATHVLSLAVDSTGAVLAGTESPGQVLRIDPNGRAFVLLDSPHDEIRSLRVQPDGSVLVVAVTGQGGPGGSAPTGAVAASPASSTPTASVSVTTTVSAVVVAGSVVSTAAGGDTANGSRSGGKGAVYRIAADGLWDELWSSTTETPYDAVLDPQGPTGGLLVGTGPDGKLYRVHNDPPRTVLLGRAPAKQITRFLRRGDGSLRYATANPGKVIRLTTALAERGTYLSEVRDAQTVATWGTLRWRGATPGGSRIELSTRSGNTAVPNATWSEWSASSDDAEGTAITSPNARYLQWRAALMAGDAPPLLTSVSAAYLPRNLRPDVTAITVHPPGVVFQQAFASGDPPVAGLQMDETRAPDATASLGRQGYRKGLQTFVWQASDGNRDALEYTVSYRLEGESAWHLLQSDMRATVFAWDTSLAPDGAYRVKVAASDTTANSPETTLIGERESPMFEIDNTAPRIELSTTRESGTQRVLPFTVRDDQSPIQRVEVWEGGDSWRVVYPIDGIADGLVEEFEVALSSATETETSVVVRATDALRNIVTVSGP